MYGRPAKKPTRQAGQEATSISPTIRKVKEIVPQKFVTKFKLPFTLVADPDKRIVESYGVWGEKVFMGRKYLGTHRVTFLIGPDGRIKRIWPKVKPEEHAAEVLTALAGYQVALLALRGVMPRPARERLVAARPFPPGRCARPPR